MSTSVDFCCCYSGRYTTLLSETGRVFNEMKIDMETEKNGKSENICLSRFSLSVIFYLVTLFFFCFCFVFYFCRTWSDNRGVHFRRRF